MFCKFNIGYNSQWVKGQKIRRTIAYYEEDYIKKGEKVIEKHLEKHLEEFKQRDSLQVLGCQKLRGWLLNWEP